MKVALCLAAMLCSSVTLAAVTAPLKEGTFVCEDKWYGPVSLKVARHPTKARKAILNWEGKDRILHQEESVSGARRYEGAMSGLIYIQTPHHSVLLDSNTMKAVLTECIKK